MLWLIVDYYYTLENKFYNNLLNAVKPLLSAWQTIYMEWLLLQIAVIYSTYKLYSTVNYLKQVLAMMWFVIYICLYLALWQLELFSCFLFLGEFTILIFFYCLFLHLRASITQTASSHISGNGQMAPIVTIVVLTLWLHLKPYILDFQENSIAYAINLYSIYTDFALNDLGALFYYFTSANLTLHALIGVILFVLTIFLFITVTLYVNTHLLRKSIFKTTQSKLFVPRGYYEQSSQTTQKFFSQSTADIK